MRNCDALKKKVAFELLYNWLHRKFNQFRDQTSWRQHAVGKASTQQRLGPQAPGWAVQENGKETRLWPIEWGSICCSSVRSPTPSHTQPFQIKWEVYFSKDCVARHYCVVVYLAWKKYNKSNKIKPGFYQPVVVLNEPARSNRRYRWLAKEWERERERERERVRELCAINTTWEWTHTQIWDFKSGHPFYFQRQ